MSQPILSISTIVKNEQDNLPKLFSSLEHIRKNLEIQIVVNDTGSTDRTVELCKKFGCDIWQSKWEQDFSKARNLSLSKCKGSWVLWMDADDVMPDKTAKWLIQNLLNLDSTNVYSFEIISNLDDGSFNQFNQIRLFPNFQGLEFNGAIHESLSQSVLKKGLKVFHQSIPIYHYGYENEKILEQKKLRNKKILEKLYAEGRCLSANIFSLARTYQIEKDYPKALKLLKEIIGRAQNKHVQQDVWVASHIYYGQILGFQNKFEEGLQFFKSHIKEGLENPQYLFEYGKLLLVTDHLDEAKIYLEECLRHQSFNWTIPTDWKSIFKGAEYLLRQIDVSLSDRKKIDIPSLYQQEYPGLKRLSICTIIKNEEKNIKELAKAIPIPSVDWVIVDTGSSDNSLNILKILGINTHHFKWNQDFSEARNFSLRQAKRPYILWLDADDRPGENFWLSISQLLQQLPAKVNPNQSLESQENIKAYRFIIESPRDTGAKDCFSQIRLIPNHPDIFFEGKIHEQLATSILKNNIQIEDVSINITHTGYFEKKDRDEKLKRNFHLLQKEYLENPKEPAVALELGNCYYQRGEYGKAVEIYNQILAVHNLNMSSPSPSNPILKSLPLHIANCFEKLDQLDLCESWHAIASQWGPGNFYSNYWLAKRSLEKNNSDIAFKHLRYIADNPALISIVASDNLTIQKNALGMLVLLLWSRNTKEKEEILSRLSQLRKMGISNFPIDLELPREIYIHFELWEELEKYHLELLDAFPDDLKNWEDYLELLFTQKRYQEILDFYSQNSSIQYKSGIIEAFIAKSLEETPPHSNLGDPYMTYINALFHFPNDPTLIFYFTEYLNSHKNFKQAFEDIELIPNLNGELLKLKDQLEIKIQGTN